MIVLLTDFGQGEYVGVMKGVIYSINGDAKVVDLCHDISPQNTIEGSWILKNGNANDRLSRNMAREYNTIFALAQDKPIDMRTAAHVHALRRLGEAIESKGMRVYFLAGIQ